MLSALMAPVVFAPKCKRRVSPRRLRVFADVWFPIPRAGASQTTDAKRKFVTAKYVDGVAEIPVHCPWGGDGEGCRVHVHDRRNRKCGPGFALYVVRCQTHSRAFTLYPPGWYPWGRAPADDGFAAAKDAAAGDLWPESRDAAGQPSATTQRRQIVRCAMWLGLSGDVRDGEAVCDVLRVPLAAHADARRHWAVAGRRDARGRVIADVLAAVPETGRGERLLKVVTRGRFEQFRCSAYRNVA